MTGSAVSSPASSAGSITRRFPIGAEYVGNGQTHIRVWAPAAQTLAVIVESSAPTLLQDEGGGYFSGVVEAAPGARYSIRLNGSNQLLPDPASRFQPEDRKSVV